MARWLCFLDDETGAISIDWVSLTAGLLLLGLVVVYAIFNGGVSGLVSNIGSTLAAVSLADPGAAPAFGAGGSFQTASLSWGELPVGGAVDHTDPGGDGELVLDFLGGVHAGLTGVSRSPDAFAGAVVTAPGTLTLADGTVYQIK